MVNCIALDDEPIALDVIRSHCDRIDQLNLLKTFTQASRAKAYIAKHPVDLIFLDIEMPDINGMNFYRSLDRPIMVIFTTAYSDYAVEGFSVDAIDYLLKPIRLERITQAAQKAYDYNQYQRKKSSSDVSYLFIRANHSLVKVEYSKIVYLEKMDDYIRIHIEGEKPVLTLSSMKAMIEKLPDHIRRVHRSYSINIKYIDKIVGKKIHIAKRIIPIGKTYTLSI